MAEGYQRQIGAGTTPRLDMADADTFGAGVGRAIEGLGGAVNRLDLVEQGVKRNEETAAAGKAFAQYRLDASNAVQTARENAAPGAAGHPEAVKGWLDKSGQGFLDGISDKKVRQRFETQLADFNAETEGRETSWQAGQRVAKLATDETDAQALDQNHIQTAPTLAEGTVRTQQALDAGHARIDAYENISADDKAKMKKALDQGAQAAVANLGIRTDPAATRKMADAGAFDDLPREQLDGVYRGIGVEERRQQAIAAHQAELLKSQARERLATLNARIEAGEDVPDADLQQGHALATAIGDDSGAYKLDVARVKAGVNKATQPFLPQQYESAINGLLAKGEKRTPTEDIQLKQLQEIAPARSAAVRADPAQWASLNGHPPPALDPADPASVAQRVAWADGVSRATRLPPAILTGAEADAYKAEIGSGVPSQRLEAAQTIARFGGGAEAVLRQVGGDDEAFKQATRLARLPDMGVNARDALTGGDALKANPNLFKAQDGHTIDEGAIFAQATAGALADLPASYRAAAMANARNIYAARMSRNGQSTWNEGNWRGAIQSALGGLTLNGKATGGIAPWKNGTVLVPTLMTADDLQRKLSRSSADQLVAASGGVAPVWAHEQPVTIGDIRTLTTPVAVGDGRYKFKSGNGFLQRKGVGGDWIVDVRSKALP